MDFDPQDYSTPSNPLQISVNGIGGTPARFSAPPPMGGMGMVADAATGLLGLIGAGQARRWNAKQAELNRDFQERMSNTAYQRSTADMKAAGINPMLAFMKGGASQPGGSQAAPTVDAVGPAVSTALAARANVAQVQLLEAQAQKARAEAVTELSRPDNIEADTSLKGSQRQLSNEQAAVAAVTVGNVLQDTQLKTWGARLAMHQGDTQEAQTKYVWQQIQESVARTKLIGSQDKATLNQALLYALQGQNVQAETILKRLEVPGASSAARFYDNTDVSNPLVKLVQTLLPLLRK